MEERLSGEEILELANRSVTYNIKKKLGRAFDKDDTIQDVAERLLIYSKRYNPEKASLRYYLYQHAKWACNDSIRKQALNYKYLRGSKRIWDYVSYNTIETVTDSDDWQRNCVEVEIYTALSVTNNSKLDRIFLKRALEALTDREREIIFMHFFAEKTGREIGDFFEISESRVSHIIEGALLKCRQHLEGKQQRRQEVISLSLVGA